MQRLEGSCAVRDIYIYNVSRLRVKELLTHIDGFSNLPLSAVFNCLSLSILSSSMITLVQIIFSPAIPLST